MIKLFYPSSLLHHKNHRKLLSIPGLDSFLQANNIFIYLTISPSPQYSFDNVICLGRISHVDCLRHIASADALLWCSEYESFGLPLFEAFNANTPIITLRRPYVLSSFGDSVYSFESFDTLADVIKQFAHDCIHNQTKIPVSSEYISSVSGFVDLYLRML